MYIFIKKKIFPLNIILIFFVLISNGKDSKRIINGRIAAITDINFQVSIQINKNHICGGSIISEYHIITSATCVTLDKNIVYGNIKVYSGSNYLTNNHSSDARIHDVSLVIIHPEYNMHNFWANDISILKITKRMHVNRWNRNSVRLSNEFNINNNFWVSGWGGNPGASLPEIEQSDHLRRIQIKNIQWLRCMRLFQVNLNRKQHCALAVPSTSFITLGDSGGPVSLKKKVYGIVSVVSTIKEAPILYTKIPTYINWINQIVNNY